MQYFRLQVYFLLFIIKSPLNFNKKYILLENTLNYILINFHLICIKNLLLYAKWKANNLYYNHFHNETFVNFPDKHNFVNFPDKHNFVNFPDKHNLLIFIT